jgi:GTPase SAR1 family protein
LPRIKNNKFGDLLDKKTNNKKKVILFGPAGTGKTTIREVFFSMSDPIDLLKKSLAPTRGYEIFTFKIFNLKVSFFDLAGQEIERWIGDDQNIFTQTNYIINVFEITYSLEEIMQLLVKINKILNDLNLATCPFYILLHKIDLRPINYVNYKKQELIRNLNVFPRNIEGIKLTSVQEDFFLRSYYSIIEIIYHILGKKIKPDQIECNFIKEEISLILNLKKSILYDMDTIMENYNINSQDYISHLKRLEHIGFISSANNYEKFKLTNRASIFKNELILHKTNLDMDKQLIHTLININPAKFSK